MRLAAFSLRSRGSVKQGRTSSSRRGLPAGLVVIESPLVIASSHGWIDPLPAMRRLFRCRTSSSLITTSSLTESAAEVLPSFTAAACARRSRERSHCSAPWQPILSRAASALCNASRTATVTTGWTAAAMGEGLVMRASSAATSSRRVSNARSRRAARLQQAEEKIGVETSSCAGKAAMTQMWW